MNVLQFNDISKYLGNGCGIGLGNFDGLHLGHMALISRLVSESHRRKIPSLIYTFSSHPNNILNKRIHTPQILTMEKKIELLAKTKTDYLYLDNFDSSLADMEPEEFVKGILVDRLNVRLVTVGFNYTFGRGGSGNVELLRELSRKYFFDLIIIPPVKIGNNIVSSTLLRKYITRGTLEKVRVCSGRDYSIYGIVEVGRQIGSTLGFPTANIIPEDYLVLPKQGVYITRTLLEDQFYNSITNIGRNPTFGDQKHISVETHIFGREGNLYGKRIEVFFLEMLREEKQFSSKEELCSQIRADIYAAREFFNCRLTE